MKTIKTMLLFLLYCCSILAMGNTSQNIKNGNTNENNNKSESLILYLKNGNSSTYLINERLKFSFNNSNIIVSVNDSEFEYSMDDISKIVYSKKDGNIGDESTVNVAIIELLNAMMGIPSTKFDEMFIDVNGDGVINIADIVVIVNILLK